MNKDQVEKCTILKVIAGSHAYGFATNESDIDVRGVCIPPKEYFLSIDKKFEQYDPQSEDIVIYNIQKFIALAANANPSMLEILWIDEPHLLLHCDKFGYRLKLNRDLFLSMKVKHTFSGYAFSQLKRIETHRKWLLNPPDHRPTREEFGLSNENILASSELGAINKIINEYKDDVIIPYPSTNITTSAMRLVQKENEYRGKLQQWHQYEGWKKQRNPARADLEKKFGYDTKHASHLVRLLKMGVEILKKGKLILPRPDADELKDVRAGEWSYEKLMNFAKEKDDEMNELYEHPDQCAVPYKPNRVALNDLCIELIEDYWR